MKIIFDNEDANVFIHNDDLLRAEALRFVIVPRLQVILKDCCKLISEIYGPEVLEKSTFTSSPSYRLNRSIKPIPKYFHASVGLGGARDKGMWNGVEKKNGKRVQILPIQYTIQLSHEGICIYFTNMWLRGLSDRSYEKYLRLLLNNWEVFEPLFYHSSIIPYSLNFLDMPVREVLEHKIKYKDGVLEFASRFIKYPISDISINGLSHDYVSFFILYNSFLELSAGHDPDPTRKIERLVNYLESLPKDSDDLEVFTQSCLNYELPSQVKTTKIIPSLRWRVFSNDKWKCRSCGRSADDEVVLQVDHIIPRSKGGSNNIENLQTLCWECNIGKSNTDSTDLRRKADAIKG